MKNRFGILIVKKINRVNIPLLFVLSVIGFDVRYMFLPESMKDLGVPAEDVIRRLNRWGLTKINFSNIPDLDQYGSLKHCPKYAHMIYLQYFSDTKFNSISSLFDGLNDCQAKIPILIYETMVNKILEIGDLVSIAHAYQNQNLEVSVFHRVDFLLSKVLNKKTSGIQNIYPYWLGTLVGNIQNLTKILKKATPWARPRPEQPVSLNSSSHLQGDADDIVTALPAEVVYFPHMGVHYGKAFLKDHFYDEDPKSPLHPSRILHVELNNAPSEDTLKYYDDNNISFIVMTLDLAGVRNLLNKLVKASTLLWRLAKKGNSLVSTFHVYGILLKSYISFLRAQQNISELEGAKLALVGFDYLFPTGLALALQARGIKLAAVQERVVHVFDNYFHPVFDTYFISGPTIRDRLKKNPFYCIGEMPIVGLVRAELLKNMLDDKTHDGERMVLVLDFHSNPDEFADFFNPLVSWQANHEFYLDILRLAENHLDIQFVIRGKNDAWCAIPYFADVLLKINAAPNVKVNHQYDKIGVSYNLTALTDLVIARQTSLGDEALAVGIPVLFHDWHTQRKFNVSTICDYNGYDIYTHDFETLSARVDAFFMENIYLPHDVFMAMRSEFYAEPINNTKNMVLNHLKMILNCR